MNFNIDEFYPTPETLLEKICEGMKWSHVSTILEPSAGKGDICNFIKKADRYESVEEIDCIEKDKQLQALLRDEGYRVIHDDFLDFKTYKKYDLIFMNPPFSEGAKHLLKALDIQKHGGSIICILNAETIRNPYTNERKDLVKKLTELNADIQYMAGEFENAERKTSVEIAVIKVTVPEKEKESDYYDMIKKLKIKEYREENPDTTEETALADNDFIKAIVMQYETELEAGIAFIREYWSLRKHIMHSVADKEHDSPILNLKLNRGYGDSRAITINGYVKEVRLKYWKALFENPKFTGKMTSAMQSQYQCEINELAAYDFSKYNIMQIKERMEKSVISGIEQCIIKLFDKLTFKYAFNEYSDNIHYYNGWKTNDACRINQKVILPWYSAIKHNYSSRKDDLNITEFENLNKLCDMEKALNYLDRGLTTEVDLTRRLHEAKSAGQNKNIHLKFFDVTFYKKGTIHITFTNPELLKKLNIFGSQKKGWLPFSYGKKRYSEMSKEEQDVIDGFEGKESYEKVMDNSKFWLFDGSSLMIEEKSEPETSAEDIEDNSLSYNTEESGQLSFFKNGQTA